MSGELATYKLDNTFLFHNSPANEMFGVFFNQLGSLGFFSPGSDRMPP